MGYTLNTTMIATGKSFKAVHPFSILGAMLEIAKQVAADLDKPMTEATKFLSAEHEAGRVIDVAKDTKGELIQIGALANWEMTTFKSLGFTDYEIKQVLNVDDPATRMAMEQVFESKKV